MQVIGSFRSFNLYKPLPGPDSLRKHPWGSGGIATWAEPKTQLNAILAESYLGSPAALRLSTKRVKACPSL